MNKRIKKKDEQCMHCEWDVHTENNCWTKYSEKMSVMLRNDRRNERKRSQIWTTNNIMKESVTLTAVHDYVVNSLLWIVNLMTTHYICCDCTVFSSIKLLKDDSSIWEIFELMYTQEIEMIKLQLKIDNKHQNITLINIYLMSDMRLNLFS
jgi:hypothetical protein